MRAPAALELTTPRLRLRQWRDTDEVAMAQINLDPEVARYLNRPVGGTSARAFLAEAQAHWDRHRCGIYAVEPLEAERERRLLGFVGLAFPAYLPSLAHRLELGWRLRRDAWGHGYATEAAATVRDHAIAVLGADDLVSIIHPENERSRRVAAKLGMAVEAEVANPRLGRIVEVWSLPPGWAPPA
jgi:RimJ/RimL family protein N-acetyltransferase